MPNLFEVTDPRGWKVICTEDCWNQHVLFHHLDMAGREDEVKQTIEKPTYGIYQDATRQNRYIYYCKQGTKSYYIKVVVDFDGKEGEVITAFPADSMKAGEKWIWPSSD